MLLCLIKGSPAIRKCMVWVAHRWITRKVKEITRFAGPEQSILDIGTGNGLTAAKLIASGYKVVCVDVADLSVSEMIRPVVYDGERLPFADQTFDVALLVSVLHHTHNPRQVLTEASRVAHRVLILEDTFRNPVQRFLTMFADTIVNMGHSAMTYQNRNEAGWAEIFNELGLEMTFQQSRPALGIFRQTWFIVQNAT